MPAGAHAEVAVHEAIGLRIMVSVWIWLLALTAGEVLLAYFEVPVRIMLTVLIGASLVKAALIMSYFMHLKFERLNLVLTLIPALVMCLLLLNVIFPDSFRLGSIGVFR